jgi:hypothetical protein
MFSIIYKMKTISKILELLFLFVSNWAWIIVIIFYSFDLLCFFWFDIVAEVQVQNEFSFKLVLWTHCICMLQMHENFVFCFEIYSNAIPL